MHFDSGKWGMLPLVAKRQKFDINEEKLYFEKIMGLRHAFELPPKSPFTSIYQNIFALQISLRSCLSKFKEFIDLGKNLHAICSFKEIDNFNNFLTQK